MEHFHTLINKKLTGSISALEETELRHWLRESAENELLYRRMVDAWKNGQYTIKIKGQQATFERIERRLGFEEITFAGSQHNPTGKNWNKWYRIAAIFILLMAAVSIFYFNISNTGNRSKIAQTGMTIKQNPAGQKARISLPDGTVCWLNAESEIKFLPNFTDSARDVYLKGEAYFEVAKDATKPFSVHSTALTVTALGTIFNVNAFPDHQKETVALIEGRISVRCKDRFYDKVLPGEAIDFNKDSKASEKISVEPKEAIAWKDGILDFNNETYHAIFAQLERWYGVKITVVGHAPTDLKYKSTFKDEILVNVLKSMSYGHKFDYKIDGKNVKIMFNKNQTL